MDNKIVKTMIGAVALTGTVIAGPIAMETAPEPSPTGDFCKSLKGFGKLYKNKSNPYIQEFAISGRFHYQAAYHDGSDFANNSSNDTHSEIRRTRLGFKLKALNGFQLKAVVNLEDGGDKDYGFGYTNFDTVSLGYNFGDLGPVKDFSLSYGRHKHTLSGEAHESSNRMKTVERANISNFFFGSYRPTGFVASGKVSDVNLKLGLYSTDEDSSGSNTEFLGGWNDGVAYYLNAKWNKFNFDFLYNNVSTGDDDLFGHDWSTSLSYNTKIGNWDMLANVVYGQLTDGDGVYGLVLMPSKFIIPEKLEFVARYQFAASDGDNLRLSRRYARGTEGGRGDMNHSIYAGVSYHFCGNNSKLLAGIEYETLDNKAGDSADATTLWLSYRIFF